MKKFIVTRKAIRPASNTEECFYCQQLIGTPHKDDCVLIKKKIKIKMSITYEVDCPSTWDKEMIEFHRNEGTSCASNAVREIKDYMKKKKFGTCLCPITHFEYLKDVTEPFLKE